MWQRTVSTWSILRDGDELVGATGYNSLVFASGPAPDMVLFESATTLHTLLGDHHGPRRDRHERDRGEPPGLQFLWLKSQTPGGYAPFHRFTGKPFDIAVRCNSRLLPN
jgi:hypothetical protein